MSSAVVNTVPATSTRLAHTRAAPRLQAQLHSGLQLPSTLAPKPQPKLSKVAKTLCLKHLKQAVSHNNVVEKKVEREQAAAASKAEQLAQRAANPELAASTSNSSCVPEVWKRPARDPNAPHPATFLMHPSGFPQQLKPQQHQHSCHTSHSCAPQQHQHSSSSSCQSHAPLTRQPVSGSAQPHQPAACNNKPKRLLPAQAAQPQMLRQATPASVSTSQPHEQHSQSSPQAHAPQQLPLSLGDKVAAKFAAFVPPSVQRRATASAAPSLREKLAAKYAAFLAEPACRARLVAAALHEVAPPAVQPAHLLV